MLLSPLCCYQSFPSIIAETESSVHRFCHTNWIPQFQRRTRKCYTHPFSDPTFQSLRWWFTRELRAGASPSAARCESPAQPKGHLLPDGNPTQRLWPPLITQRQGYGGFGAGDGGIGWFNGWIALIDSAQHHQNVAKTWGTEHAMRWGSAGKYFLLGSVLGMIQWRAV